jgi:hypothetical protein
LAESNVRWPLWEGYWEIFIFQPIRNRQIVFSRALVDEQTIARHFLLENVFQVMV